MSKYSIQLCAPAWVLLCILAFFASVPDSQGQYFVATNGNDAWSGTAPAYVSGANGPFLTLGRAQAAVRGIRSVPGGLTNDVAVLIRGGWYFLEQTWTFDTNDSGTVEHSITYEAYSNEIPVISGGRVISGWVHESGDLWYANLPNGLWFNQLYVDGQWAIRARWPNIGDPLIIVTNRDTSTYQTFQFDRPCPVTLGPNDNAEVTIWQHCFQSRGLIVSAIGENIVTATNLTYHYTDSLPGARGFIEHALAFVDQPLEWYLNRTTGKLTYMVSPGDHPSNHVFYAPRLQTLVRFSGQSVSPIRNVRMRGLSFKHALWLLPETGIGSSSHSFYSRNDYLTYGSPVAVELNYAQDCVVESCSISQVGGSGLGIGPGCKRDEIRGCHVSGTGVNGITGGWGWQGTNGINWYAWGRYWPDEADTPDANEITDNHIHDTCRYLYTAAGIHASVSSNALVAYNLVEDSPYMGIYLEADGIRWNGVTTGGRVEQNHIRRVTSEIEDGGAISPRFSYGTVVQGNLIHDVLRNRYAGGNWNIGIYVDDLSSYCTVRENLVFDLPDRYGFPLVFHDRNLLSCHTIENNAIEKEVRYNPPDKPYWLDIVIPNNSFYGTPSPSALALAEENTGPRSPYRGSLLGKTYSAREIFNDWPTSGAGNYTNAGWILYDGGAVSPAEPCLGKVCRFGNTAGSYVRSPFVTNSSGEYISFWARAWGGGSQDLRVEKSTDGTNWVEEAAIRLSFTNWCGYARRLTNSGPLTVRIRKNNAASSNRTVDIDAITVGPRIDQPPVIVSVWPPNGFVGQDVTSTVTVTAVQVFSLSNAVVAGVTQDVYDVASVSVNGAFATNSGGNRWSCSAVLAPGSNSLQIIAVDFFGNGTTQTVFCFRGNTRYVALSGGHTLPFDTWARAATNIQAAVDAAVNGDLVLVSNGVYISGSTLAGGASNRVVISKAVTLKSVNGPGVTIIAGAPDPSTGDGHGPAAIRCVYVDGADAEISGFTLTNGYTRVGNVGDSLGVGGGMYIVGSRVVVSNCIVRECRAKTSGGLCGAGICLYQASDSVICNSTIMGNKALSGDGGGIYMYGSGNLVKNCLIVSNEASVGGGIGGVDYYTDFSAVENCYIVGNTAHTYGAGVFLSASATIRNCTIVENTADASGGGIVLSGYNGYVRVYNSIVVSNHAPTSINYWVMMNFALFANNCTSPEIPFEYAPVGNIITDDPGFMNWTNGDYHLSPFSVCIDRGMPMSWMTGAADNDGTPRITPSLPDIGADEVSTNDLMFLLYLH